MAFNSNFLDVTLFWNRKMTLTAFVASQGTHNPRPLREDIHDCANLRASLGQICPSCWPARSWRIRCSGTFLPATWAYLMLRSCQCTQEHIRRGRALATKNSPLPASTWWKALINVANQCPSGGNWLHATLLMKI